MTLSFNKLASLTADEMSACGDYQGDATFFHACTQGWSGEFTDSQKFRSFLQRCSAVCGYLDAAINKFEVKTSGVVYSGHGLGLSVLGSLVGQPEDYVGFSYSYPGFTSTSEDPRAAENFLRTRSRGARTPVMLEIRLHSGQKALPFHQVTNSVGEAEVLLPRSAMFAVIEAKYIRVDDVKQDVLQLTLEWIKTSRPNSTAS